MDRLAERIQRGDKEAFEVLFHAHYSALCCYANRFIRDSDDSEEIVQDTFVRFWNRRAEIKVEYSLKSYLFQAVRNASFNFLKHAAIVREHEAAQMRVLSEEDHHDEIITMELAERIARAVDQLPEERRKIFRMSRDEGLKYKEIADQLNISPKTVENQIGRALSFLRSELAEYLILLMIFYLQSEVAAWGYSLDELSYII